MELVCDGSTVVFSGDLGRYDSATMPNPAIIRGADYLIVESTYGDRTHDQGDPEEALAELIGRTVGRGGRSCTSGVPARRRS